MNVLLKGAKGYESKEFSDQELVAWFTEHTKDGIVEDDIILFKSAEMKVDDGLIQFVFSDGSLDSDLERVDPTGWDLKRYRANPLVLWQHDWSRPAIGTAPKVRKDDKGLYGGVKLDDSGLDLFAMMVEAKVRSGILSKGSVGFKPTRIEIVDDKKDPTRLIHREQELIEFSIVNMPANVNATVISQAHERVHDQAHDQALVQHESAIYNADIERLDETSLPRKTSVEPDGKTTRLDDLFIQATKPIGEIFI